ncbi:hypothetical protein ACFWPU_44945 [Streptomyces sp. NPDC058471]|uniref:hypothetical protein n=1 Tax=Streptomyces sp. NPDC058471 TaxID=3346516 RepID=UPI00366438C7
MAISVAMALLCGWAFALPKQSLGARCLLTASITVLGVIIMMLARRYRTARACRTSYQWHVNYLEDRAKSMF